VSRFRIGDVVILDPEASRNKLSPSAVLLYNTTYTVIAFYYNSVMLKGEPNFWLAKRFKLYRRINNMPKEAV